jgi:hypothetical protein
LSANVLTAKRRVGCAGALVIAAVTAVAIWLYTLPSTTDGLHMGEYGAEEQWGWAQQLTAGLKTGEAAEVPVLRAGGAMSASQAVTIEAALLAPGCRYTLVSVSDRGEQWRHLKPGHLGENQTYRFDMTVHQRCPAGLPLARTTGVMAMAEMGYWDPLYFVTD